MKVVIRRYARLAGGRFSAGECLMHEVEMADHAKPIDAGSAEERSRKAVARFFPDFTPAPATLLSSSPYCWRVAGPGWSVTWQLPGYAEDVARFLKSISGVSAEEAARIAIERINNETIHATTGVPA